MPTVQKPRADSLSGLPGKWPGFNLGPWAPAPGAPAGSGERGGAPVSDSQTQTQSVISRDPALPWAAGANEDGGSAGGGLRAPACGRLAPTGEESVGPATASHPPAGTATGAGLRRDAARVGSRRLEPRSPPSGPTVAAPGLGGQRTWAAGSCGGDRRGAAWHAWPSHGVRGRPALAGSHRRKRQQTHTQRRAPDPESVAPTARSASVQSPE